MRCKVQPGSAGVFRVELFETPLRVVIHHNPNIQTHADIVKTRSGYLITIADTMDWSDDCGDTVTLTRFPLRPADYRPVINEENWESTEVIFLPKENDPEEVLFDGKPTI